VSTQDETVRDQQQYVLGPSTPLSTASSCMVSDRLHCSHLVIARERSGEREAKHREQSSGVILDQAHGMDSAVGELPASYELLQTRLYQ